MKPLTQACLVLVLACEAGAHRLDEYLQATRVSVATNRIELSIELAPGVAVADQLLAVLDCDGDGTVSQAEGQAYARGFLGDVHLHLDGKPLSPGLMDAVFPILEEFGEGLGVIRIKVAAPIGDLDAGAHVLSLTNTHLPEISVYQVNALRPADHTIAIRKQVRNGLQTDYRLEFEVGLFEEERQ